MKIAYQIKADGVDVTDNFRDRLVSLTLVDEAGQSSDTAEIVLDDRNHAIALPAPGAKLSIALGSDGDLAEIGTYIVDEISGEIAPALMTISAKAADMTSQIRGRKTRSWQDVTIAQIVERIATEHGLEARVGDSLAAMHFAYLAQTAESDLHFLTRIARDLDAVAKPAGGFLLFVKRGEAKAATGAALPVVEINGTDMSGGSWQLPRRVRYNSVAAEWSDREATQRGKVTVGQGEPSLLLRHLYANEAEAERAAEAKLEAAKRASGTLNAHLAGFRSDLIAEGKVRLSGIKPELTSEWFITRVQHQLNTTLTTRFTAERDQETPL